MMEVEVNQTKYQNHMTFSFLVITVSIYCVYEQTLICVEFYILVLKLTFSPDPFRRNLPLSNGLISRFLSRTCTEVSGIENIGQCGRLSQLRWLLGAL